MELWLKYKSEDGAARRVSVNAEKFSIGRHSENDLCIPSNQLSRRHAEIDRYEDAFILTDANSSNGTKLNGKTLLRPTALQNGDRINLGDGAEIEVEINSVSANAKKSALPQNDEATSPAAQAEAESVKEAELFSDVKAADFAPAILQPAAPKKSGMGIFFILVPVMIFFVLIIVGLILWLAGGSKNDISTNPGKSTPIYLDDDEDNKPNKNKKDDNSDKSPTPSPTGNSNDQPVNSSSTPNANNTQTGSSPVPNSSENDTIEKDALAFLRLIPNGNANPVLTAKQIGEISRTIKSVKGAAGFKDNLQSLKKNAAQIESLAKTKNLRPQFLAAAAIAKGGDPLAAAQAMAGDLNSLANQIANESSDESLMVIAAYSDGGGQSRMPSMLANLTKSSPADARRIRTIWFLHDNGKISEAQYQFALKFLAVGTIMQNPKDFNVQSEAVVFN